MSKNYLLLLAICFFSSLNAQIINIPDANFKARLLEANILNVIAKDKNQNNIKIDLNEDGEIQESEALNVYFLKLNGAHISSLIGIKGFSNLSGLDCGENEIVTLDVSNMSNLFYLFCYNNQLVSFNYSGLKNLAELNCQQNQLATLDLSLLPSLGSLICGSNKLVNLDVSKLPNLQELSCHSNQLTSLDLSGQNADIFYSLICFENNITNLDLAKFNNLRSLNCSGNKLTNLNITAFLSLEYLEYSDNKLGNFNVTKFPNLIDLSCGQTETTSLDLNGLTKLVRLSTEFNKITNLDLTGLINLKYLSCSDNLLSSLDLKTLEKLEYLSFGNNQLTDIDLKSSPNLKHIDFFNTQLKTINLSECSNLESMYIYENPLLESIFIKNGSIENEYFLASNPNLRYICADEDQITQVENVFKDSGHVNFTVNSFCSFVPGGIFYTIQGNNRIDMNGNGCDLLDIPAEAIKLNMSDGTKTGSVITDNTGNYSVKIQEGNYSITPVLENSNYFTVTPTSIQVEFPLVSSQYKQDFCLIPIGSHKDLEIVLIPLKGAIAGSDVAYKIIYKNRGNVAQSGIVNLIFNDAVLDLVSSSIVVSSQSLNSLNWNFYNLTPLETREITIVLKLNSPTNTPGVNLNDILTYKATVNSSDTDETPIDNLFELRQVVVGSYDPNDKTCLEGDVIKPELIGEYVHYMIRFENTGTYPAKNIVVKDMIDLSKFDISTLIPTSGSHSYVTKISDGNKVEFIFENINLPFDNANKDGYIAFKIKTLPTLTVGDSFVNEANIYFDYNFPILTNKATSTFKVLSSQDFEFSNYFNVYPIPTLEVLNITSKNDISIQSMEIYNILGQLVIAVPNAQSVSKIDVSKLITGNYILKIKTDKGVSGIKFIKK